MTTNNDHQETSAQPQPYSVFGAYKQNVSLLRRYVMRLLNGQNDVDDVVQEAFLRAFTAENKGSEIKAPRSYLFRVAKNVVFNQVRQKNTWPTDYLEEAEGASLALVGEWTLEDEMLAQEKLGIHCAAVASLPPKCRKVYLMRKVYGMSHKDIASTLGITPSTVETHLEKGFLRCRDYVETQMDTGRDADKSQQDHVSSPTKSGGRY